MPKYKVTEAAGSWVAGTRNNGVGSELDLTAAQAAHELRLGTIVKVGQRKAAPAPAPQAKAPEAPVEPAPRKKSKKG